MSIITEEVLLDETGDDLNEREANKGEFAQPILIEDLGHYDTKRILSSLTDIMPVLPRSRTRRPTSSSTLTLMLSRW